MLTRERSDQLLAAFPFLATASPDLAGEMRRTLQWVRLSVGRHLFQSGDCAEGLPLLLSGSVRVYQLGRTGREITLYRLRSGEACLLSANAILSGQRLPVAAVVEERSEAVLVPSAALRRWVGEHPLWREFVFSIVGQRLADVLRVVDAVLSQRMDTRVATLLLERGATQRPLRITHHEIAAELGTSREVVSRILENLADAGLLRVGRGRIEIQSPAALAAFAVG